MITDLPIYMNSISSLTTLLKHSPLLFFSYDLSRENFVILNSSFIDFFGLSKSKVLPVTILDMIHPDDRPMLKEKIEECLKHNRINTIECRVIRKSSERLLRINAYLSRENGTDIIVGHAEDITAHHEYNNNLQNHNNEKNSILNILTHDLSGPISTIGNLTELIQHETQQLDNQKVDKYISMINKITAGAISLIRNFLNQEFLESQAVTLLKTRVEIISKLTIATQEYFNMAPDLNLTFFCSANKESVYVDIDEDKFLQAINNLISNAMKFTPDGGNISIFIEERKKLSIDQYFRYRHWDSRQVS